VNLVAERSGSSQQPSQSRPYSGVGVLATTSRGQRGFRFLQLADVLLLIAIPPVS
jgi:hypothetical protein